MSSKNYREIKHHTNHRAMKKGVLVCGIEDIDVRVIETYPGHTLDVRGMFNH